MIKSNYHIHTSFSDGKNSVAEVIKGLKSAGVNRFAITDHDCIDGLVQAESLARANSLHFTSGVELSCCIDDEANLDFTYIAHIVALDFDLAKMSKYINAIVEQKQYMLALLFSKLVFSGYSLDKDDLFTDGKICERKSIAAQLVQRGYAKTVSEAFDNILNAGKYRRLARNLPFVYDVIKIIHACDGLAIAAHPFGVARGGKKTLTNAQAESYVQQLSEYGIDGIEVYYKNYSPQQILFLERLADKYKLLKSIGSDTHHIKNDDELAFSVQGITPKETVSAAIDAKKHKNYSMRALDGLHILIDEHAASFLANGDASLQRRTDIIAKMLGYPPYYVYLYTLKDELLHSAIMSKPYLYYEGLLSQYGTLPSSDSFFSVNAPVQNQIDKTNRLYLLLLDKTPAEAKQMESDMMDFYWT